MHAGDYAWNRTSEALHKNIHRTVTWSDVDVHLRSVANGHGDASEANPSSPSKQELIERTSPSKQELVERTSSCKQELVERTSPCKQERTEEEASSSSQVAQLYDVGRMSGRETVKHFVFRCVRGTTKIGYRISNSEFVFSGLVETGSLGSFPRPASHLLMVDWSGFRFIGLDFFVGRTTPFSSRFSQ